MVYNSLTHLMDPVDLRFLVSLFLFTQLLFLPFLLLQRQLGGRLDPAALTGFGRLTPSALTGF